MQRGMLTCLAAKQTRAYEFFSFLSPLCGIAGGCASLWAGQNHSDRCFGVLAYTARTPRASVQVRA